MSDLDLGNNYEESPEKENEDIGFYKIYESYNKKDKKKICLKVLSKENFEDEEEEDEENDINYGFFLKQMIKEGDMLNEFKSDNIIKLNNIIQNEIGCILEIENYDMNMLNYMNLNPFFENGNIEIYKKIILTLVHALKELKDKGIIHRNIKPENIYKLESEDDSVEGFKIKLANFDCAIYIKDVENSKPMISLMYSAPEIINNKKYNEKSDYWSLGITLFELYFGNSPFGQDASINDVKNIINNKKQFIYRKTCIQNPESKEKKPIIPTLDVLFKRLLCINPDERMTLEELCDFVENENFLKENKIYDNPKYSKYKYTKIYEEIKKEKQIEYDNEVRESFKPNEQKIITKIIELFEKTDHSNNCSNNLLDIKLKKDEPKQENKIEPKPEKKIEPKKEETNKSKNEKKVEIKYNNIIYYDENKKFLDEIYKNCEEFEENTQGTFVFCNDLKELKLLIEEILQKTDNKNKYLFNLITSGATWENTIDKLLSTDSNFKKMILNVCIFCKDIKKYNVSLKKSKNYNLIKGIWCTPAPIIKFIEKTSRKDIVPFPCIKLLTYSNYKNNYKKLHKIIANFYGPIDEKTFKNNYKNVTILIEEEDKTKKLKRSKKNLEKAFKVFNSDEEINTMKLIIKEYTKDTMFKDFNRWMMLLDEKYYLHFAYFSARLMYSLDNYGKEDNKYYNENNTVYRGITLPFIGILRYKIAEHKIIIFPAFTSTSIDKSVTKIFNQNKESNEFSVVFYIKNIYEKDYIPNGVDIHEISAHGNESEILFQAFSFYYVDSVQINIDKKNAFIYLKTIGKKCILEKEIKSGKDIEYDKKDNIIKVK